MNLSDDLRAEIDKWSERLEERLSKLTFADEAGKRILKNVRAYQKDSVHFLRKSDLIKSFECLIWAWAHLEIGMELGHLVSGS